MTLNQLQPGTTGIITDITIQDATKLRLMTMGIVKGTAITYLGASPFGDPIKIELRGYTLSLRLSEAKAIHLKL